LGYHAQQCAEKYLKAYLVQKGVDFPYTHSISALLELCGRSALWAASLADAEDLTRFSTTARYPGIGKAVSKQEAVVALETAKRVRSAVRLALEEAGVDLVSRGK
jgi:HEPN domain-containing protein